MYEMCLTPNEVCWIRQQPNKSSVVKPSWLPMSNCETSLRIHERLKDQLRESGLKKEKMKKTLKEVVMLLK